MTTITTSKFINHGLSVAGWLAVFLLTLEISARADDWWHFDAAPLKRYEFDQLFSIGAHGPRGTANARYLRWRLNSEGLRGPEVRPDTGQTRILTYGASETFGMFETAASEYPRALERELNGPVATPRFEVLNAALPGMRVGSGVAYLADLATRFNVRAVLIYPTPTHYIGVTRPYCGRAPRTEVQTVDAWPGIRIAEKFREVAKQVLPSRVLHAVRRASISWQTRHAAPAERVPAQSLAAFSTDVQCAVDVARANGVVPILITHANRFGRSVRDDDALRLTQWRAQYPDLIESGFVDLEERANAALRMIAATRQVALVDADASLSGNPQWFADHAHFSDDGAATLARLLAPAVRAALSVTPK
jgi:hypothetical protein